jgi:GntR family transcriptional regulator, rspAB operon transcriptional repressor
MPRTQAPAAPGAAAPALKDQAFARLRALILSGELEAGTFISERQMVERLKMSKTPIRVAFERLEQDGFVEILPQRGVRVRELSEQDVVDHYDLRIALETWIVRRAARRRTPEDVEALQRRIEVQERLRRKVERSTGRTRTRDVTAYSDEDARFHAMLAELAANAEVIRILANQRERLTQIVARHIRDDPALLSSSIAEHGAIVDAVAAGDGERAARAVEEHLERGKAALLSR